MNFKKWRRIMLNSLTSLRFFAAMAVFLVHLYYLNEIPYLNVVYNRIFIEGSTGVTFFFILSGFILTYNYYHRMKTLDRYQLKKFYIARVARIYPVHLMTFLISIPLFYSVIKKYPLEYSLKVVTNLTLLQSFIPLKDFYFSFNGVSWSLSNELFFYLLLPFILYSISNYTKKFKLTSSKLIFCGIGIWLFAFTIVFMFKDITIHPWLFYILPMFRIIDFTVGIILGLSFISFSNKYKPNEQSKLWSIFEILSIVLLGVAIYFVPNIPESFHYSVYYLPFMSIIIYIFAHQKGIISRMLSKKQFVFLGEISFSFYMIHQLIINYIGSISVFRTHLILSSIGAFLASLILSAIIYTYYEIPLRNKIRTRSALYLNKTKNTKLFNKRAKTS
jgi:peptidoglycan/LPS O-acetylase OafA/YrhL